MQDPHAAWEQEQKNAAPGDRSLELIELIATTRAVELVGAAVQARLLLMLLSVQEMSQDDLARIALENLSGTLAALTT